MFNLSNWATLSSSPFNAIKMNGLKVLCNMNWSEVIQDGGVGHLIHLWAQRARKRSTMWPISLSFIIKPENLTWHESTMDIYTETLKSSIAKDNPRLDDFKDVRFALMSPLTVKEQSARYLCLQNVISFSEFVLIPRETIFSLPGQKHQIYCFTHTQ